MPATFLTRLNRFVVRARLRDGESVTAHLADPGRLKELLLPGAELRLRPAPTGSERTTRFSVALVRAPAPSRVWVSVEAAMANRLAAEILAAGRVRGAGRGHTLKPESRHGRSRFDFLLEKPGLRRLWVEVKSVTFVENGIARFPDAPTVRGRRHVLELAGIARRGERAMVLFIVQRADARLVTPYTSIDPAFAAALGEARRDSVLLRAAGFKLDARGGASYLGPLPVRTPASLRPGSAARGRA